MTVHCMTCQHWSLRDSPLAVSGFGRCSQSQNKHTYFSPVQERDCQKHEPTTQAVVDKRFEYLQRGRK
jgi:hypothetical protein